MTQTTTPISDRRVYAQEQEPTDTRDGILWVDTSKSPRETFVYSTDTESWENVIPEPDTFEFTEFHTVNTGISETLNLSSVEYIRDSTLSQYGGELSLEHSGTSGYSISIYVDGSSVDSFNSNFGSPYSTQIPAGDVLEIEETGGEDCTIENVTIDNDVNLALHAPD